MKKPELSIIWKEQWVCQCAMLPNIMRIRKLAHPQNFVIKFSSKQHLTSFINQLFLTIVYFETKCWWQIKREQRIFLGMSRQRWSQSVFWKNISNPTEKTFLNTSLSFIFVRWLTILQEYGAVCLENPNAVTLKLQKMVCLFFFKKKTKGIIIIF